MPGRLTISSFRSAPPPPADLKGRPAHSPPLRRAAPHFRTAQEGAGRLGGTQQGRRALDRSSVFEIQRGPGKTIRAAGRLIPTKLASAPGGRVAIEVKMSDRFSGAIAPACASLVLGGPAQAGPQNKDSLWSPSLQSYTDQPILFPPANFEHGRYRVRAQADDRIHSPATHERRHDYPD